MPSATKLYYKSMCLNAVRFLLLAATAISSLAAQTITIDAGTVIDGKGAVLHDQQITIDGSRITAIHPGRAPATYNLRTLTVMPGWIDTHVHLDWHFDKTRQTREPAERKARRDGSIRRGKRICNSPGWLHHRPERRIAV